MKQKQRRRAGPEAEPSNGPARRKAGNARSLPLIPAGSGKASVFLGLWGVVFLKSTASTSDPWTPPSAFVHNHRSLPRHIQHADKTKIAQALGVGIDLSSDQRSTLSFGSKLSDSKQLSASAVAKALSIDQLFGRKSPRSSVSKSRDSKQIRGKVIRTAARPHQSSGGSAPSSPKYTTRKQSLPLIKVGEAGVTGDYNHYRTVALKSTRERAISLLTRDVSAYIQTLDGGYFAKRGYRDGDLGENLLIEGVDFDFFRVGRRYRFSSQHEATADDVIIEVTEPMEPCANLCKLPYINDPAITDPKEKLGRCQYFIAALGQKQGLRGWYAKVVKGGVIRVGDVAVYA